MILGVECANGCRKVAVANGIAKVDPDTNRLVMVAKSPVPVQFGGDILDNHIYFGSGSHLVRYQLSTIEH